MRQIETLHFRLSTTRPRPPVPPKKTPRPQRWCAARPKSTEKSPKGAPEQAWRRTRTTARHRRVTKAEPTSTSAAYSARNLPETAPDERRKLGSLKALINAVRDIPTVSSLRRWRPARQHEHDDPRAGLRAAQERCPHRPRSARVATQWPVAWLSHLEQRAERLAHHLLDHAGRWTVNR